MKYSLLLLIGILFSKSLFSQNKDWYLTSKLQSGCPTEIEPIKKQLGFKDMSYALLETGLDSVDVIFGQLTQGETNGYWISIYFNNVLKSFSTVQLDSESLSNEVNIEIDNSKGVSLYVTHNSKKQEINYYWLNENEKIKRLTFESIIKPISIFKQFPNLKIKSVNGESLSVNDFKGKIVIINWWATTCAPCRKEIPGLNKLVEKYESNINISFLAISFDKKDRLVDYLKQNQFDYYQTLGDTDAAKLFGETFPQHIIVDKNGTVLYVCKGGNENIYLTLEKEIKKYIKN